MKFFRSILRDKDKGDGAGGAGDGGNKPDLAQIQADLAAAKAESEKLKAELDKLKAGKKTDDEGDDDLLSKAKKDAESKSKSKEDATKLEDAIKFNLSASDFFKKNSDLLPSNVENILATADKETYDSVFDRVNAIKVGILQSFFEVQSNIDLLTASQRKGIDDYLKLTKNGKEQRASSIFETIFEPTLENLRRVKKAEELSKGFSNGNDSEKAYKERLIKQARKSHLGEK